MEELEQTVDSLLSAGIVQQVTRSRIDSSESISGIFRCDFEPGQQRYSLNIPVHPVLADIPSVEAICLDCDARIRVSDCQRYGVRLEIVLHETSDENQCAFVEVCISSKLGASDQ